MTLCLPKHTTTLHFVSKNNSLFHLCNRIRHFTFILTIQNNTCVSFCKHIEIQSTQHDTPTRCTLPINSIPLEPLPKVIHRHHLTLHPTPASAYPPNAVQCDGQRKALHRHMKSTPIANAVHCIFARTAAMCTTDSEWRATLLSYDHQKALYNI